jgi:hypothetical protein
MKRVQLLVVLGALVCALSADAAVRGTKVKYVGGTAVGVAEKTEGELDLSNQDVAVFTPKSGQKISIPYKQIESLEYGQKVGRRVGVAVAVSPLFLFSKKRKHFLSIGYNDEQGKRQGVVFEMAKGIVRPTLSTFEAHSGKQVEFESEEARKNAGN